MALLNARKRCSSGLTRAMRYSFRLTCVCAAILASCAADSPVVPPLPDPSCEGLYGEPNMNTGLSTDVCFARIEGNETWTTSVWDTAAIAQLRSWTLENPPTVLTEDPYEGTVDLQPEQDALCAVMLAGELSYRLETFESVTAAEAAGGIVTHGGACGACSSLEDLAAYVETPDQTGPVRQCALDNLGGALEELDDCIQAAMGFTPPCGRIYAYSVLNSARECRSLCFEHLDSPYNEEDGSLNPCLQCDDDNSGAVFKVVAGRTRRTTGVPAAICRPCETIWRVDHRYD